MVDFWLFLLKNWIFLGLHRIFCWNWSFVGLASRTKKIFLGEKTQFWTKILQKNEFWTKIYYAICIFNLWFFPKLHFSPKIVKFESLKMNRWKWKKGWKSSPGNINAGLNTGFYHCWSWPRYQCSIFLYPVIGCGHVSWN